MIYSLFTEIALENKKCAFRRKVKVVVALGATSKMSGVGPKCQEQDCKQLCKRIVYTLYVQFLCF